MRPDGRSVYLNYGALSGQLDSLVVQQGASTLQTNTFGYSPSNHKLISASEGIDNQQLGFVNGNVVVHAVNWTGPITSSVAFSCVRTRRRSPTIPSHTATATRMVC